MLPLRQDQMNELVDALQLLAIRNDSDPVSLKDKCDRLEEICAFAEMAICVHIKDEMDKILITKIKSKISSFLYPCNRQELENFDSERDIFYFHHLN